jgi:drug/metabolite transporter (DMT)-like permease
LNWASLAIGSAATFGMVNTIDSHLLSRRMPGLLAYLLPVGAIFLFFGCLGLFIFPFPEGAGAVPILAGVAGGLLRTSGVAITLFNLQKEEVSRVLPIINIYPIFVAVIAVPLMGDNLSYLQWLAIFIVAAGAIIVSSEKNPTGGSGLRGQTILLLMAGSLSLAGADIFTKYALRGITSWNTYSLSLLCMAVSFLALSARPAIFRQLADIEGKAPVFSLLTFNELLAQVAAALQFLALDGGPVSLVSTTLSTRPLFVAIYTVILGIIMPQFLIKPLSRRIMAVRFVATIMIVGGISIIYLS